MFTIFAEAATIFDHEVLRILAWTFTILSGLISIALSIHRFGLSPGKRISAIIGVIAIGLIFAMLVISPNSPLKRFNFISDKNAEQIKVAHKKDGNRSAGFEITDSGLTENHVDNAVNRISEFIFAVIHPDGKISAVYNGGFFDAEVNGQIVSCELIEIGDDRVLIIKGGELETINIKSDQAGNTFKVQKVPVKPKTTTT